MHIHWRTRLEQDKPIYFDHCGPRGRACHIWFQDTYFLYCVNIKATLQIQLLVYHEWIFSLISGCQLHSIGYHKHGMFANPA